MSLTVEQRIPWRDFVEESNAIEGIHRPAYNNEIDWLIEFVNKEDLTVTTFELFVERTAPGNVLRKQKGLNVRVGVHIPPPGGPMIERQLQEIIYRLNARDQTPFRIHRQYEILHPFTDGNGRSGRALWLWSMLHNGHGWDFHAALERGFLHTWYYQSLADVHA